MGLAHRREAQEPSDTPLRSAATKQKVSPPRQGAGSARAGVGLLGPECGTPGGAGPAGSREPSCAHGHFIRASLTPCRELGRTCCKFDKGSGVGLARVRLPLQGCVRVSISSSGFCSRFCFTCRSFS